MTGSPVSDTKRIVVGVSFVCQSISSGNPCPRVTLRCGPSQPDSPFCESRVKEGGARPSAHCAQTVGQGVPAAQLRSRPGWSLLCLSCCCSHSDSGPGPRPLPGPLLSSVAVTVAATVLTHSRRLSRVGHRPDKRAQGG